MISLFDVKAKYLVFCQKKSSRSPIQYRWKNESFRRKFSILILSDIFSIFILIWLQSVQNNMGLFTLLDNSRRRGYPGHVLFAQCQFPYVLSIQVYPAGKSLRYIFTSFLVVYILQEPGVRASALLFLFATAARLRLRLLPVVDHYPA